MEVRDYILLVFAFLQCLGTVWLVLSMRRHTAPDTTGWDDGYDAGLSQAHMMLGAMLDDLRTHRPLNLHGVEVSVRDRQRQLLRQRKSK